MDTSEYATVVEQLESLESQLLVWGVVDGSFTRDEICEEIERIATQHLGSGIIPEELLDELVEQHFVFEFNDGGRLSYRTRMAEALRLFARLRQIRPWNTWHTAPTLVADFRFSLASRFYPKRNIPASDPLNRI